MKEEQLQSVILSLKDRFQAELYQFRDQIDLVVKPDQIISFCESMKNEHGFETLVAVSAVDYWPQDDPRFHVIYQFLSLQQNARLGARVPVPGIEPAVPTVESVYPNANWYEREVFDMFGVRFEGHSDLRRIMMPSDWQGHPLRKDYPLGYEEVQFTFNSKDVLARKSRPQE